MLSLKEQKTQDDSWFYCKQVHEMPLRTLPGTVVYQVQVDKGGALSRYCYKETRILLINIIAFSQDKVKLKYVEAFLMFIFSIVCFLLQCGLWIYFNIKLYFTVVAARGALWKKVLL